jgi:hypothetical protein
MDITCEEYMQIVDYAGKYVTCWNELLDDSNFHVVCADEENDSIWCEGNPNSEDYTFSSWQEVVEVLSVYFKDIEEITAV